MIPATASRPLQRETPFEQVATRLPDWMRPHLPRKWVQLGRVLLLRLPLALEDVQQAVAAAYATLPGVETVMRRPRIEGELRQPRLPQLLHGSSAETEVREHGLCYRLDLQRVMWAPGNVGWRAGPRGPAAVAALYAHPGPRTVLDCFAGVGYFALQFARHWPAAKVIAIEKNPVAAEYLRQNVVLNGLANVDVIESDCRDVMHKADIVHLGYIGGTCSFLQHSSDCLEPSGTIIFHETYRNNWLGFRKKSDWNGTPAKFAELMDEYGYEVEAFGRVKTYGPSSSHIVARLKKRNYFRTVAHGTLDDEYIIEGLP